MKKEEILEKSRKENEGKLDELGMKHIADAGKIGMVVGASLCVLFVVLAEIFNTPIIGLSAWNIYFAMMGSNRIVFVYQRKKQSEPCTNHLMVVVCRGFSCRNYCFVCTELWKINSIKKSPQRNKG